MAAERAFTKLQWGKETTKGTAVAADSYVMCAPIPLTQDRQPHFIRDLSGIRAAYNRSQIHGYLVKNTLNFDGDHPLYFNILPMLFSCGLKGAVTATETTGGQSDYLWTFTPSLTAANAPDAITLEAGDDTQVQECEFLQFERYVIASTIAQDTSPSPVTCSADFFARQWTDTSFTNSITLPTIEPMSGKLTKFCLDTSWAGAGGTEKTGTLRAWEAEILTGIHPKFFGDTTRYFGAIGEGDIAARLTLTLEGNATAEAIRVAMESQALQVVRLSVSGSQIGSGTYYNLTIDVGGKWESVTPINGLDKGNNLHQAVLNGVYDITGAKILQVLVTTNVNAY